GAPQNPPGEARGTRRGHTRRPDAPERLQGALHPTGRPAGPGGGDTGRGGTAARPVPAGGDHGRYSRALPGPRGEPRRWV
ncbi:MAG: hypothetical protein AVDCRST_MAG01-01-17, partial [uncultured Rubrobacteraceae bacterium]